MVLDPNTALELLGDPDSQSDSDDENAARRLLFAKLEEREKLHGDYFKGTSIALLILGACLTFSVDKNVQPGLKSVLPLVGLFVTLGAFAEVLMGNHARQELEAEIAELMRRVDSTLPCKESLRLKYALFGFGYGTVIFFFSFLYVWMNNN